MTTQAMLDDRYGRRTHRRPVVIVAAIIGTAIAVALGWSILAPSFEATKADATAFRIHDAHSVDVSFQVTAPVDRTIACALEAQDEEHGVVGWRIVEYPASPDHTRAFTETVPTLATATTGLVNSCWVT